MQAIDHQTREESSIVIELLHADAQPPRRATEGSAGYDLFAYLDRRVVDCSDGLHQWQESAEPRDGTYGIALAAGAMALIPLGFKATLPAGYEAQVRPRSGLASRHGITMVNAPGTIDSDYRGEVQVPLINLGRVPFVVERGMRIAQMLIVPVPVVVMVEVEELGETKRGKRGFGHTGH